LIVAIVVVRGENISSMFVKAQKDGTKKPKKEGSIAFIGAIGVFSLYILTEALGVFVNNPRI